MNKSPYTQPTQISHGLAVYRIGRGEPVLLMPYPHGFTSGSMADSRLARRLIGLKRQVITFDPPGAYHSTRSGRADMAEMLGCALETLVVCHRSGPIDLIGHSMGGLCALALAIEQPQQVKRLILIGSLSGFPAARRWSIPHNWRWWRDKAYWQSAWLGFRVIAGWSNLAVHKRLHNLVQTASFVDPTLADLEIITPTDRYRPASVRDRWHQQVRRVDYRDRLQEIQAPTLLCVGRYDPQTPVACSQELVQGIPEAELVIFEKSGHTPFIEEPGRFVEVVTAFLNEGENP